MFQRTLRRRLHLTVLLILILAANAGYNKVHASFIKNDPETVCLYEELGLKHLGLERSVFERALAGLQVIGRSEKLVNPEVLSIADMSQSANSRRLYVIDIVKKVVLFNTYVSHGRNTGGEFAKSFGNKPQSFKSSMGFFLTGDTYEGAHGTSLRLKGLEAGINDKAEQRGIVVHGAEYVSEDFIRSNGRLGRSQGCPAVPTEQCIPIINSIKHGSCFFIHFPDSQYYRRSPVLRSAN